MNVSPASEDLFVTKFTGTCKHFDRGPVCLKGIQYDSVRDLNLVLGLRLPCNCRNQGDRCDFFEGYSVTESKKMYSDYKHQNDHHNALWVRESTTCICGYADVKLEQVGLCVYARPCGCRIGQGELHPEWRRNDATQ